MWILLCRLDSPGEQSSMYALMIFWRLSYIGLDFRSVKHHISSAISYFAFHLYSLPFCIGKLISCIEFLILLHLMYLQCIFCMHFAVPGIQLVQRWALHHNVFTSNSFHPLIAHLNDFFLNTFIYISVLYRIEYIVVHAVSGLDQWWWWKLDSKSSPHHQPSPHSLQHTPYTPDNTKGKPITLFNVCSSYVFTLFALYWHYSLTISCTFHHSQGTTGSEQYTCHLPPPCPQHGLKCCYW